MSDYDDKLQTAKQYLLTYPANSQEFEAAAEHLMWAIDHAQPGDGTLSAIEVVAREIITQRGNDQRALKRLTELLLS